MTTNIITELESEDSQLLNAIAESQHVESSTLHKCEISTTIKKVRYGSYVSNGEAHESCVIIFSFDIVGQQKKHDRIEELKITFSLFRAPVNEEQGEQVPSGSAALEIRLREPVRGRMAPATVRKTTQFKFGAGAGYDFAGINGGFETTRERELSDWGILESNLQNARLVKYRLRENGMLKDGVPGSFECALVLRTDGIPFSLGADFEAMIPQLAGVWKKRGRAKILVGESLVRRGQDQDSEEEVLLQNMGSDRFLDWIKQETSNNWIVAQ